MSYYLNRRVMLEFDVAVARVVDALKAEEFGVLTDIDMSGTLQTKLGVAFRPYRILGACNPALAHQALQAEDKIGAMLPCNVVVQDVGGGEVEIAIIDPVAAMERTGSAELAEVARTARAKLAAALDRVA